MAIEFILESQGVKIILPINPETIATTLESKHENANVVSLGEIIIPGSINLSKRTISSYIPLSSTITPSAFVNTVRTWQAAKSQVRFTVTNLGQDSFLSVVSNFETEIRGGEHEDVYYTIELTEYRPYGAKLIEPITPTTIVPTSVVRTEENAPSVARTYTVVSGDSLWAITQSLSGDGSQWRELYELNKDTVGSNPNLIYPGVELIIPERWVT